MSANPVNPLTDQIEGARWARELQVFFTRTKRIHNDAIIVKLSCPPEALMMMRQPEFVDFNLHRSTSNRSEGETLWRG
jgi:hypothetical protein